MIYGEPHSHAWGDVPGIAHLLKEGANRNGKIEKDVVKDVEKGHQDPGFNSGVGQKYKYQAGIFQGEYLSFAESDDGLANQGAQEIVDEIVDY